MDDNFDRQPKNAENAKNSTEGKTVFSDENINTGKVARKRAGRFIRLRLLISILGLLLLAAIILIVTGCLQQNHNQTIKSTSSSDITSQRSATSASTAASSLDQTTAGTSTSIEKILQLISPQDAKDLLSNDQTALLLDVRTNSEYEEIRIPGSFLLPVDELENSLETILEWKNKPVIVYCRTGRRSSYAAQILYEAGFEIIYDLGGIYDWPFETESGP